MFTLYGFQPQKCFECLNGASFVVEYFKFHYLAVIDEIMWLLFLCIVMNKICAGTLSNISHRHFQNLCSYNDFKPLFRYQITQSKPLPRSLELQTYSTSSFHKLAAFQIDVHWSESVSTLLKKSTWIFMKICWNNNHNADMNIHVPKKWKK